MSYRDKPRLWKTAYYLIADDGPGAVPIGDSMAEHSRRGSRSWIEWAIDLRACCQDHVRPYVEDHYLTPSTEDRRIPPHLKPVLRVMWREVRRKKLDTHGEHIVEIIWG
jgi:hypothetical protein